MNLNDTIKQLNDLAKTVGSLDSLAENLKHQAVNASEFSEKDKQKMTSILNSINFEQLKDYSEMEIKELIKSKL